METRIEIGMVTFSYNLHIAQIAHIRTGIVATLKISFNLLQGSSSYTFFFWSPSSILILKFVVRSGIEFKIETRREPRGIITLITLATAKWHIRNRN